MPLIGLGTWKSSQNKTANAVKTAIDVGYKHFDCAPVYGNEVEIGNALKEKMNLGVVDRQDLFITSKLWNTMHAKSDVRPAVEKTLSDLQLDYLDLYLIHFPSAFRKPESGVTVPRNDDGSVQYADIHYLETWQGMEELVQAGLVKAIGVSNFNSKQLSDILDNCTIAPVVNQVESHVYHNQQKLLEYCQQRDIVMTAYAPLGSSDRPWAKPNEVGVLDDPIVKELANKYKKSPAQILLKYQAQRGVVAIPKSVTPSRITDNLQIFDFQLQSQDFENLNKLSKDENKGRLCWCSWTLPLIEVDGKLMSKGSKDCPLYPFHEPF
ncbi:uncharacterized protein TRIADDRAFT_50776 [Trichoplax adhaerens]|uniref:NADP-dependent oxidoreductase domain-containing protein n=1 Tax=Trichoplax adhaerens TaxID=10228 RepID=B3S6K1_TRIAD|nr:hypothetical protein TRIADDRAFT_50776 [Trichoplax adhaerens]EDV21632.1 hypothetical protein TRIADDRAFT_50776 [Trichoplax adhaerens]|eukprot:XP_002115780.1 hypothetical protein TRIADDRAFT_50776 [Trichoplax adhaerens]